MNIILYGGSFDPPHLGHSRVIQELLNSKLGSLILVPSGPQFNKNQCLEQSSRKELISAWCREFEGLELDWCQFEEDSKPSTCYELAKKYHRDSHLVSFCIGSDLIGDLVHWYRAMDLKDLLRFIVIPRSQEIDLSPMEQLQLQYSVLDDFEPIVLSSSELRAWISLNDDRARQNLPAIVYQMITNNGWYQR